MAELHLLLLLLLTCSRFRLLVVVRFCFPRSWHGKNNLINDSSKSNPNMLPIQHPTNENWQIKHACSEKSMRIEDHNAPECKTDRQCMARRMKRKTVQRKGTSCSNLRRRREETNRNRNGENAASQKGKKPTSLEEGGRE